MPNHLIRKLNQSGFLTEADQHTLQSVPTLARSVARQKDLIRQEDRPENVILVLQGLACRYKLLPNGRRQILALLLPGDFCDLHVAILGKMDHSIATLSACRIAEIPRATIERLTDNYPRITRALWWATLVDEAILREWIVNIGQREANQQLAHLFCELLIRLQTIGLASDNVFDFPLTQAELGDIVGISNVHTNRILQELRSSGLITLRNKLLTIHDFERLKAYCNLNPNYLHLTPRVDGFAVAL